MIEIGIMALEDVEAVSRIERECFAIPWSHDAFVREVTENNCARYLVAREDGVPVAYAGMWLVLDEAHVTNIAVQVGRRGQGIGERIARALMQLAADTGMRYMTLECRRSNQAAQSLYKKLGFVEVGFRKRYYADNGEDALVMACERLPRAHPEDDPYLIEE
jgi:ribosomal-protein-alanine N-acetyltransferase